MNERDESGEPQIDPERPDPESPDEGSVHLPGLISDSFGVSRSQARMEIAAGLVKVDGEVWEGDKFDIPAASLRGKSIEVIGSGVRSYKLDYRESE